MSSIDKANYNKTMVLIGISYMLIASLFCILPMVLDLFNGLRKGKFWFPNRYFSLNVVSIIAISVLMKLPMDLNSPVPNREGQVVKLGNLAFMSTMVANMLPSLASLDNKRLVIHVIGFAIPVILVIVNSCKELNNGVIHHVYLVCIQVALLIFLLLVLICAAIAVPSIKQHLESNYQAISQSISEDRISVEKLRHDLIRYAIMAENGNPEFVIASSPLSSASGVICEIVLVIYIVMVVDVLKIDHEIISGSVYRWSVLLIVVTQSIGVVVGSISPICRSFTVAIVDVSAWMNVKRFLVFEVENYWTQMLYDWKEKYE